MDPNDCNSEGEKQLKNRYYLFQKSKSYKLFYYDNKIGRNMKQELIAELFNNFLKFVKNTNAKTKSKMKK
ncbi:MAG: hypothetical protein COZ80_00020 [Ignavibacteria bacterium CG_4_8_14_3_um_filter_37_9]|nr:MAG: hypothetical protein AUJ54_12670 [Ignavibacteria bacterium CG1_02_37_35]PIP78121.1 MAG: hypothetical protein COW85_05420 [Ignavibacteria bacterium CG22_combo_CG10-13_8_21_14_all_37_15]PIS44349.1 MAG: hypothetical protein COT22_11015 [Ignavibacteria bacterium CG08_land_8_20_14_0_20_37_9]PIX00460.1 MAG: hypothetical protein COZ80_00020 [Ignavibacteria bacterium CG_4_8_14_3_um_filter_37_9]PIX95285.1 MAG: hypothetical protein COZ25_01185 [Ignavibacteria bacterium CG_4_10_14_3_um_filter_37_1